MTSQTPTGDRHSTVLPGDRVVARAHDRYLFVDAPAVGASAAVAELRAALESTVTSPPS